MGLLVLFVVVLVLFLCLVSPVFRISKKSLNSAFIVKQKGGDVGIQLVGMDGRPAFINSKGISLRPWEAGC